MGPFQKLFASQDDYWMIDDRQSVVRVAPHTGHGPGLADERPGGQNNRWRTEQLGFHCVVHTARGAGTSFRGGMNGHITFVGELL